MIRTDVAMADYLTGRGLPAPAVSGSDLANLDRECAAYAYAFWRGNPRREESPETPATALGTATHCYVLEGAAAFTLRYLVKPAGMNFATKEGKAWRDGALEAGREIVTYDDFLRIQRMRESLVSDPDVRRVLMAGGKAEQTMVAQDAETGLWLLARPDLYIEKAGMLVNLKTARSPAPSEWERQFYALRYYISDAFVRLVARLCGVQRPTHAFVVVGNDAPHLGYLAAASPEAAEWGDRQVRLLLNQFAACVASGRWPGYGSGVIQIGLPAYAAQRITQKLEAAE